MKKLFLLLSLTVSFISCNTENLVEEDSFSKPSTANIEQLSQKDAEQSFSEILSKAIFSEPSLRRFLKEEALKKNDNDHNVFYPLTKNKLVDGRKTLNDILSKYAKNQDELRWIESAAPLLNIFIPDLTLFDKKLSVEALNVSDQEIPVFNQGKFYIQGIVVDSISEETADCLPIFHTFVVNQSHRMKIKNANTRATNSNIAYEFADEAYNPNINQVHQAATRSRSYYPIHEEEPMEELYDPANQYIPKRHIPEYILKTFEKVGPGAGVLRAMYTFGLNEIDEVNKPDRKINKEAKDAIFRLRIDPSTYYLISNHKDQQGEQNFLSPFIKPEYYKKGGGFLTVHEALKHLWTDGNFTFKINIITGNRTELLTLTVKPQDLFYATVTGSYKHATFFKKAQYWYKLSPNDLKGKWIYPHKLNLDTRFSSWDPFKDGFQREIIVSVAGSNKVITREVSVTYTYVKKDKLGANVNLNFTLDSIGIGAGLSFDKEKQTTEQITNKVTIQTVDKEILLGNRQYDFLDASPITKIENDKVYLNTDRYGCFDMTILPVSERLY